MTVTIGYESDWSRVPVATTAASHRSTTSSRHPGVEFKGVVRYQRQVLEPCECGGLRMAGDGAHSPHWVERAGLHVQVDCMGRVVR